MLRMKAADISRRREHNDRMTLAFWSANWGNIKSPPKLQQMLVDVDAKPNGKKDWRAIKTALRLALSSAN